MEKILCAGVFDVLNDIFTLRISFVKSFYLTKHIFVI